MSGDDRTLYERCRAEAAANPEPERASAVRRHLSIYWPVYTIIAALSAALGFDLWTGGL